MFNQSKRRCLLQARCGGFEALRASRRVSGGQCPVARVLCDVVISWTNAPVADADDDHADAEYEAAHDADDAHAHADADHADAEYDAADDALDDYEEYALAQRLAWLSGCEADDKHEDCAWQ